MAALVDVISSRDVGSAAVSWDQEVEAIVRTADKAAQCTRPESKREATQTDVMQSFFSAGCQTEDALPDAEVDVVQTGVTCERCSKFFLQKASADRHWRLHQAVEPPEGPQEPYCCPYCSFSSLTRKSVKVHERRTHTEDEAQSSTRSSPRRSARCCLQNQKTSQLVIRKREPTMEKSRNNVCSFCKKRFSTQRYALVHERLHTREKTYPCQFCPQCFALKSQLDSHERKHTRSKTHVCDVCQKSYFRERDLVAHAATHMSEKPFKCDVCQRRFSWKQSLVAHASVHMNEKPFECDICKGRFTRKFHLSAHKKRHANGIVNLYSCNICQESFPHRSSLTAHKKLHTKPIVKLYSCRICQESFSCQGVLVEHENRAHNMSEKPYACIVCHEVFPQRAGLLDHHCTFITRRMAAASVQSASLNELA